MTQLACDGARELVAMIGAVSEKHRRIFLTHGGTYLGLALAEELSRTLPIVVPRHYLISLEEMRGPALVDGLMDRLAPLPCSGFVVKYSGHNEAFSPRCVRGVHSSRSRFWDGRDEDDVWRILRRAAASAPQGTQSLVVQEIVRHPSLTGIFLAYAYASRVRALG